MTIINPNLFARTGDEDFSNYIKALIAGAPKSGKTRLLGTVPNILICDTEPDANNMQTVRHLDLPVATIRHSQDLKDVAIVLGSEGLRRQLAQQRYGLDDIGAVAIDTMDTLQKILKRERMDAEKRRTFERDDWGWLKTEMEKIVEAFTNLPMHVFFTVHLKMTEVGGGVDRYSKVEPGLEGAIASSIAGMVGYSMMTFRQDDVDATTGQVKTNYFVRTEGNKSHDFLGTRIDSSFNLPPVINPDMGTIYSAIQASRAAVLAAREARAALPEAQPLEYPQAPVPGAQGTLPPGYQPIPGEPIQIVQGTVVPTVVPATTAQPVSSVPVQQAPPVEQPVQTPAQNVSQEPVVQTPVQTPEQPIQQPVEQAPAPEPTAQPVAQAVPSEGRPGNDELVNVAALGHLRRIYDTLRIPFPEEILKTKTMGEAREISTNWKAIMADHAEGKGAPDATPESDMLALLQAQGLVVADAPAVAPTVAAPAPETLDITAPIATIQAYIGNPPNLARVQETYDAESAKGDRARSSLLKKLVELGAQPPAPAEAQPVVQQVAQPVVQTPVETPAQPVTPPVAGTDTPNTEVATDPAQMLQAGLGAQVVSTEVRPGAPCEQCGNPIDDVDLAELGLKRFGKVLCVNDYVTQTP